MSSRQSTVQYPTATAKLHSRNSLQIQEVYEQIHDTVDHAVDLHRRHHVLKLHVELPILDQLNSLAQAHPVQWHAVARQRKSALCLWLFQVAIAAASAGHGPASLDLLERLPGVPGAAEGRRGLLRELMAWHDAMADLQTVA